MAITGLAGGAGSAGLSGAGNSLGNALKGMSTQDLGGILKNQGLSPELREAAFDELLQRALQKADQSKKSEGAEQGQGEEDELQKLLKKLKDGTISQAELQKLAKMLGVEPEALQGMMGKGGAGAGAEGGCGSADTGDIR